MDPEQECQCEDCQNLRRFIEKVKKCVVKVPFNFTMKGQGVVRRVDGSIKYDNPPKEATK